MNALDLRIPQYTDGSALDLSRRSPLLVNPYRNRTRRRVSRRAWGVALVLFFAALCGMIAFSEWWAYNKNIPYYEHVGKSHAAH